VESWLKSCDGGVLFLVNITSVAQPLRHHKKGSAQTRNSSIECYEALLAAVFSGMELQEIAMATVEVLGEKWE
jgi:hypothetical protein